MKNLNMKFIRGKRIQNQLNEAATFNQLQNNTENNFSEKNPREVQVSQTEMVASPNSAALIVQAKVTSSGTVYTPAIQFSSVDYSNESTGVTVQANGQEYNILPINLAQSNVKVFCNCLDFYWRFAKQNASTDALIGDPPAPYKPKTNRAPANPSNVPGVCKHIMSLVQDLKRQRIVT